MISICDHTIDETLLTPDSKVLDIGMREGKFSTGVLDLGVKKVYAVDPDPDVVNPQPGKIHLARVAAYHANTIRKLVQFGNGTGNYVDDGRPYPVEYKTWEVACWTLGNIFRHFDTYQWDVIKLDCEGAELGILNQIHYPVSKQITIEAHVHTGAYSKEQFEMAIDRLRDRYDVKQMSYLPAHGCGENYWDTLLIAK